ncbi:MAG TPA: hypothetical protein VL854_10425 [Nitrososphaeraceae archaeon]|nr:hypothetical protein [Nitrososphaeraceae archaeon]
MTSIEVQDERCNTTSCKPRPKLILRDNRVVLKTFDDVVLLEIDLDVGHIYFEPNKYYNKYAKLHNGFRYTYELLEQC